MAPHHDLVDVAAGAARRAARYVRQAARPGPEAWDRKEVADFVTHVDREAERIVRQHLVEAFPDSRVIGEELSPEHVEGDLVWIVDPLDGTTNFLHGYPWYAVSVGARQHGALVAGAVVEVVGDVCYQGGLDRGAAAGERPLRVSSVREPRHALIGTGFPFKEPALAQLDEWNRQLLHLLRTTSGIRRAGAAALDLVDVAQGRLDGYWEYGLSPWDVAAGIVLVREAGGRVTDRHGNDVDAPPEDGPVVAGTPAIHDWLLTTFRDLHGD